MPRKKNPAQSLEAAKQIYREFHGGEPEISELSMDSRTIPNPLIVIGRLTAVEYEPIGGSKRKGDIYRHEWGDTGSRKLDTLTYLCTDESRRKFFLIEGKDQSYPVFNSRGIVG